MRTFIIGDIHGAAKALVQVLERSKFDYENDMLITLGDIVDGWSGSYDAVEELLKIKNRIDIIGNHDSWFTSFIKTGRHPDYWRQGGMGTMTSYLIASGQSIDGYLNPADIPETHKEFFKKQISYYKDDNNNIFVHGGFDRRILIKEQNSYDIMWNRDMWNQAMSSRNSIHPLNFEEPTNKIFIGHTTTMMWKTDKPMKASNVWNLDTGAGYRGKLTIMNLDTEEYFQSDLVQELYKGESNNR